MLAAVFAFLSFAPSPGKECGCSTDPGTTSLDHSQEPATLVSTNGGCVNEHFQEGAVTIAWCDTDVANGKWAACGDIPDELYSALEAGYEGFTGENVCVDGADHPTVEVRPRLGRDWAVIGRRLGRDLGRIGP